MRLQDFIAMIEKADYQAELFIIMCDLQLGDVSVNEVYTSEYFAAKELSKLYDWTMTYNKRFGYCLTF